MAQQAIVTIMAALLWSGVAFAHHPFSDEFDRTQTITLNGTITKIEWRNPHVYTYLDVKDSSGKAANWKVEMGSPDALTKDGWTRTSVKVGDQVTIQGWRGKNSMMVANAESFVLPDGSKMAAASSFYAESQGQLARGADQDRNVGTSGALPATASPLALYALIGGLAAAGALGLRAFRG